MNFAKYINPGFKNISKIYPEDTLVLPSFSPVDNQHSPADNQQMIDGTKYWANLFKEQSKITKSISDDSKLIENLKVIGAKSDNNRTAIESLTSRIEELAKSSALVKRGFSDNSFSSHIFESPDFGALLADQGTAAGLKAMEAFSSKLAKQDAISSEDVKALTLLANEVESGQKAVGILKQVVVLTQSLSGEEISNLEVYYVPELENAFGCYDKKRKFLTDSYKASDTLPIAQWWIWAEKPDHSWKSEAKPLDMRGKLQTTIEMTLKFDWKR